LIWGLIVTLRVLFSGEEFVGAVTVLDEWRGRVLRTVFEFTLSGSINEKKRLLWGR